MTLERNTFLGLLLTLLALGIWANIPSLMSLAGLGEAPLALKFSAASVLVSALAFLGLIGTIAMQVKSQAEQSSQIGESQSLMAASISEQGTQRAQDRKHETARRTVDLFREWNGERLLESRTTLIRKLPTDEQDAQKLPSLRRLRENLPPEPHAGGGVEGEENTRISAQDFADVYIVTSYFRHWSAYEESKLIDTQLLRKLMADEDLYWHCTLLTPLRRAAEEAAKQGNETKYGPETLDALWLSRIEANLFGGLGLHPR